MNRRLVRVAASLAGVGLLAWIGWGAYAKRTTERVPYAEIGRIGDVELREYPETIVVTTRAESEEAAFRRLFEYIGGANRASESVSMTAPVATDGERSGFESADDPDSGIESEDVSMTAPVRTDYGSDGVRMAFFLPAEYTTETAPRPTDPRVELVIRPPRTVAVRSFSGLARDRKRAAETSALLDTLDANGIDPVGEPSLLQYDNPYTTLPFTRHNEVAIDVECDPADRGA